MIARTGTDCTLAGQIFYIVAFVGNTTIPEPFFGEETVNGVLGAPVIRTDEAVLSFAVVLAFGVMPPIAVTRRGLEGDVVIVGVLFRPLEIQRCINAAFPDQVRDHRFGLHDLLDAGQFDSLGCLTIGQRHLAILGRLQRLGDFARVLVLFDQKFLITLQGFDLFPVQRDRSGVLGLEQQLTAIEDSNGPRQPITIFQPDGIGEYRHGGADDSNAQQGSRQHKQRQGSGLQGNRASSPGRQRATKDP